MSQESAAQLIDFVYEAFGASCADLLMVGVGEEPVKGTKKVYIEDVVEGKEWEVEIEVVGGTLPCRSEPLVLATLLKMLIGRKDVSSSLEFHMSEIVDELQRVGVTLTPQSVDHIISKYVALSYDKRAKNEDESDDGGGGMYSLITAYVRNNANEVEGTSPMRVVRSVHFEKSFVAELGKGEVFLAGIRFEKLVPTS